ncbi:MAG: flagellar basal body P-ring formation chaperone FlgA [Paracoccaceae bacterium]
MRTLPALLALLMSTPGAAETLVAARTLRAKTILAPEDVAIVPMEVPGSLSDPDDAIGLETRIAIYQGQPILTATLGPPAIIDRNQIVLLRYRIGALTITADGRSLDRAGIGDRVRAMNISSRTTVNGVVGADGSVDVAGER